MRFTLCLIILLTLSSFLYPGRQQSGSAGSEGIAFRDTVNSLVFDSLVNDLGIIDPEHSDTRMVKYFRNIGTDTLFITRTFTSDPHYICRYPGEALIPGLTYSYEICFWHRGRTGLMRKTMGFSFSDGTQVILHFTGRYISASPGAGE